MQEERRDAEEDDGQRPGRPLELRDLLVDQLARRLIGAAHGAEPAVGLQDGVDAIDRLPLVGADGELDRDVVEAADESRGLGQRVAVHPGDAEVPRIGQAGPRVGRPHELGRDRDADDPEPREPPVDDGRQRRAGRETPGSRRRSRSGRSRRSSPARPACPTRIRVWLSCASSGQRTETKWATTGSALPSTTRRKSPDDAPLDGRDPGQLPQPIEHRARRALEVGEDVREARVGVERVARRLHRRRGGHGGDEARDAAADEQARS